MTPRFRLGLVTLALAALAGCDLGISDPVSIALDFEQVVARNTDGTCTIRYSASAAGVGRADWVRATILENGTVAREYAGAATADFWGESTISAGEQQVSEPYVSPSGANVQFDIVYRVGGPERSIELRPNCPAA